MSNPINWSPTQRDDHILIAGKQSVPRPLSGRAIAGLGASILVVLGAIGALASGVVKIDPVETGSVEQPRTTLVAPAETQTSPKGRGDRVVTDVKSAVAAAPSAAATALPVKAVPAQAAKPAAEALQKIAPVVASSAAAPVATTVSAQDNEPGRPAEVEPVAVAQPAEVTPVAPSLLAPATVEATAKLKPTVQIADSESEIATLEETTGMVEPAVEAESEIARLALVADPPVEIQAPAGTQPGSSPPPILVAARTSRWVTMRAGPADEARPIRTLPAEAAVQSERDCGWCAVEYQGQRGYIYKNFIRW